jgi:hypothetical protein
MIDRFLQPQLLLALLLIGMFGWAYSEDVADATMKGALIGAMIPTFLITRYGPTVAKVIFWGAIALLVGSVLGVAKCSTTSAPRPRSSCPRDRHGAAVASGSDAVGTSATACRPTLPAIKP